MRLWSFEPRRPTFVADSRQHPPAGRVFGVTERRMRIKDYLCFFNEVVDRITVGNEVQARPQTKWSRD